MYDLSECTVRISNTSIERFNLNYWKAESIGSGQISYRTEDYEYSFNSLEYHNGIVEFTAITNTDHYLLKWSTEDVVSHKAMKYETNSNYFNDLLVFGYELPSSALAQNDRLLWEKFTFFKIEYSDGRIFEVPFKDFVKGETPNPGISTVFDFGKITLTDINGVSFKLRPTAISSISIVVYPDSYGTGVNTFIEDFKYSNGNHLGSVTISNYDIAPRVGDEIGLYGQRAVVSAVGVDPDWSEEGYLKVEFAATDGVTIVVPPLSPRRTIPLTNNFRFHFASAVSLTTPLKYNFALYQGNSNYGTNFEDTRLQAWSPLAPIISGSVTPIGITAEFDTLNGVSPRLFAEQSATLGRGQRIIVKMGSENWQETYSIDISGGAQKLVVNGEVNDEFKKWCLSLYNEADSNGFDGLNIMISDGVPADSTGFFAFDPALQADADGNVVPYYNPISIGQTSVRNSLSDIVDYLYNYPVTPATNIEVSVDNIMFHYNDYNGWFNIYGDTMTDAYVIETTNPVPTPFIKSVHDVTPQDIIDNTDYFAWLNGKLGVMILEIISDVSVNFPSVKIDVSVNVPSVQNAAIPVLEPVNNISEYDSANWDKMFISSYEHILSGDFTSVVSDFGFYVEHNFLLPDRAYISGKVSGTSNRWKWTRVDRALNYSEVGFTPLKYVDGVTETFRDGFFWFGYNDPSENGFGCGGCNG